MNTHSVNCIQNDMEHNLSAIIKYPPYLFLCNFSYQWLRISSDLNIFLRTGIGSNFHFYWLAAEAASQYSCHLVIPVFIFRRSSPCGDVKGKSLPSGPRHLNNAAGDWSKV